MPSGGTGGGAHPSDHGDPDRGSWYTLNGAGVNVTDPGPRYCSQATRNPSEDMRPGGRFWPLGEAPGAARTLGKPSSVTVADKFRGCPTVALRLSGVLSLTSGGLLAGI